MTHPEVLPLCNSPSYHHQQPNSLHVTKNNSRSITQPQMLPPSAAEVSPAVHVTTTGPFQGHPYLPKTKNKIWLTCMKVDV